MAIQAIIGRILIAVLKNQIDEIKKNVARTVLRAVAIPVVRIVTVGTLRSLSQVKISMNASLKMNPGFNAKWEGRFHRAQVFLDNQVLMDCDPYVPFRTGTLVRTGILGTHLGTGRIQYIAPYARRQYYFGRMPGQNRTKPLAGRYWFERAKVAHKDQWIRGVKEIIRRG